MSKKPTEIKIKNHEFMKTKNKKNYKDFETPRTLAHMLRFRELLFPLPFFAKTLLPYFSFSRIPK